MNIDDHFSTDSRTMSNILGLCMDRLDVQQVAQSPLVYLFLAKVS